MLSGKNLKIILVVTIIAAASMPLAVADLQSISDEAPKQVESAKIEFNIRRQELRQDDLGRNFWYTIEETKSIPAKEIAIIICDVWNEHPSKGATIRINILAPRIDSVVRVARAKGIQIIHAPSDTTGHYKDTPARKRILATLYIAPPSSDQYVFPLNTVTEAMRARGSQIVYIPPIIREFGDKSYLPRERIARDVEVPRSSDYVFPPLPLDVYDSGSDTRFIDESGTRGSQHPVIEINQDKDVISDSGREIYSFLRQKGIKNIIMTGTALNSCILERSFGIKQMLKWGMNVLLARDLTDILYNPELRPYVSYDQAKQLMVGYIEKFICPTIASSDLLSDENVETD